MSCSRFWEKICSKRWTLYVKNWKPTNKSQPEEILFCFGCEEKRANEYYQWSTKNCTVSTWEHSFLCFVPPECRTQVQIGDLGIYKITNHLKNYFNNLSFRIYSKLRHKGGSKWVNWELLELTGDFSLKERESSTNWTPAAFLYTNDNQLGKNDPIYSSKESYKVTRNKFNKTE